MIRSSYPDEFERLWTAFGAVTLQGLGEKGSKKLALAAFKAKKIEANDIDYLINRMQDQIEAKLDRRAAGLFDPDFQHLERWIRNERFDDEICRPTQQPRLAGKAVSRRDQARAAIQALTGEGEANTDGVRETGQLWLVK